MENQVRAKRSVNYAFKIVGNLAHDNKLFDRTCPTCRKGMYSSRQYTRCPKCGGMLGYLTSGDGKAISISEGTIYPAFGPKQEKSDANEIARRKNGMPIKYRFKMFNFIDEHGVLTPPAEHDRCRSGAKVEILSMGHQLVPSWFMGKDENNPDSKTKIPWVELMILIYTGEYYNDYVKVLTTQEYASKTVSHNVNPDGTPAAIAGINDELAALEQRIAAIKASQAEMNAPVTQPEAPENDVPWEAQNAMATNNNSTDPFAYAK